SSCGREPAEVVVSRFEETWQLGRGCAAKQTWWDKNRQGTTSWSRLVRTIMQDAQQPEDLRPDDFEEIGKRSSPREGYLAVVYADGDRMGETVRHLTELGDYKKFASTLDDSIFEATADAMKALGDGGAGGRLPLDILLVGGDDVVAVLPAQLGLPFALHLARKFTEVSAGKLKRNGLDEIVGK